MMKTESMSAPASPATLESKARGLPLRLRIAISIAALVVLAVPVGVALGLLAPAFLVQQLQVGSFLGLMALGGTLVILLGHIDLSVPATVTFSAVFTSAFSASVADWAGPLAGIAPLMLCLGLGVIVGLVNGAGVVFLRIPSMIWTLGMGSILVGVTVLFTGSARPRGDAPALAIWLGQDRILGVPAGFLVLLLVTAGVWLLLKRSDFGRTVYAVGHSEKVAFLSGLNAAGTTLMAFTSAGMLNALGGLALMGYAEQAYQGMGNPYLLPTIAAIVVGGTSIQGGRGSVWGTLFGVQLITLKVAALSVAQVSEAVRLISFGLLILLVLILRNLIVDGTLAGKERDDV